MAFRRTPIHAPTTTTMPTNGITSCLMFIIAPQPGRSPGLFQIYGLFNQALEEPTVFRQRLDNQFAAGVGFRDPPVIGDFR
jgi:hypothetical protein